MHPRLNGNRFYNWLMYCNRSTVFERLEKLIAMGATIMPYSEFVETHLNRREPVPGTTPVATGPVTPIWISQKSTDLRPSTWSSRI